MYHITTFVIVPLSSVTACHVLRFEIAGLPLQEEAEAEYKAQFPDHYAAFADLAPADDADPDAHLQQQQQQHDTMELDQPAADGDETGSDAAAATAAQAKSAAAKSLLEGQLLQDVVALHHQLFSALAVHRLQHQLAPGLATAGGGAATAGGLTEQQQLLVVDDAAREKAFTMCFSLGQQLVAAQQGLLPAAVDQLTLPGSIMALALQHRALNTSAAATAAAAAAQPQQQLDMQQPFPEEAFLMQQPLSDMSHRLIQLLEEWPEHPLLLQLLAIVERLLGLPLTVPLKQALTGLELLLARAQVWEETAAKHVSLKQQLTAVAGLATRWRKLELASWKGLLERVRARHAAGASKSWYHLYQVLVLGTGGDSAAADADAAGGADATAAGAGPDAAYRRTASLVEAFVQTSTVGEYAARLQLLQSFACQLTVTAAGDGATAAAAAPSSSSSQVASMLWNVLSYYTQFLPAVSAAIDAGLGPLSKELTDFVKLAKWENRGYYAMKVSTEKAQRQLHRLSRRAEDYLKQPAAGVLASASQAMGLGQVVAPKAVLAAAAAAGRAAGKAAKVAAATAAAAEALNTAAGGAVGAVVEAPPDQQQQQQQKERDAIAAAAAAAAAEVDPALLAELDASDLTHAAAAAGGGAAAFASSLDGFAAAALAAGGWQPAGVAAIAAAAAAGKGGRGKRGRKAAAAAAAAGQLDVIAAPLIEAVQQLQPHEQPVWAAFSAAVLQAANDSSSAAAGVPASSSSSSSSYAGRLPKLAARMARVLAPPTLPAPSAAADPSAASLQDGSSTQQQQYEDQLVAALPALQLDDLAATAASRALSLSTDTTKGARLRKKKALTDLLHALGDAGFSKRASDVPASDRDAAAWFGQSQPCLASSPLLQPLLQGSSSAAAAASLTEGLTKGLTAGAVDSVLLQLAGVCWSKADSYYFKSLARLQRLQAAAKAPHADLARHEVLAVVGYSQHQLHLVRQQRLLLGEVAGSYTQLLQAVSWLQETASSSGTGAAMLLPPQEAARGILSAARQQLCSLAYQLSAARQLIAAVIPMQQSSGQPQHVWKASASAAGKLASYIAAVDRHRAAVDVEWARIRLAGCPVVGHAALAVAAAAFGELQQMQQDAEAGTSAIAAAATAAAAEDAPSSSSGSRGVVCRLVPAWDRVLDALDAAAAQASAVQQQANMQQRAAVNLQQCQQQFVACLDEVVAQVLLAAQALHSSSNSSSAVHQQSDATAAAAVAVAEQQGAAAAAADMSAVAAAAWSDALKPARLSGLAASVRTLLSLLAQASNANHTSSDTAAAVMASQAAGLLQLLLGGLQRSTCQLLLLHKSLAKLSYVCSSIFCSLICEGYCMPEGQEGEAQEGTGEGELQWQDAGGTGMGEGTGKKDVSDQIQNEDQLLGAQQKDQQKQDDEPQQQQQDDDGAEGVEMDGDFDGSLHDIDDRRQQQQGDDEDEEDEEGDDDRIDQQMGEVRDACWVGFDCAVQTCCVWLANVLLRASPCESPLSLASAAAC
jgi:midasin